MIASQVSCISIISESVSKEGEDVLQPGKAVSLLSVDSLDTMVAEKMASLQGRNLSSTWCDETTLEGAEISDGNQVRLRTKGEGPYLGKYSSPTYSDHLIGSV